MVEMEPTETATFIYHVGKPADQYWRDACRCVRK
jgi:hypothetical protein